MIDKKTIIDKTMTNDNKRKTTINEKNDEK